MSVTAAELRRLRPFTICEVEWEDAFSHFGDTSVTEVFAVETKCIRFSLGYIIRADKDYVIIAETDDRKADHKSRKDKGIADALTLPTSLVRGIRVLEKPTRR